MIFALADTHLSFRHNKPMHIFHQSWRNHPEKLQDAWQAQVGAQDLVLVAGDISWANKLAEADLDLQYLAKLNGQKLLLRGNHDYWWSTLGKMRKYASEQAFTSLHFLLNNAYLWLEQPASAFAQLLDCESPLCREPEFKERLRAWQAAGQLQASLLVGTKGYLLPQEWQNDRDAALYAREAARLSLSYRRGLELLAQFNLAATECNLIVMTHYPPLSRKQFAQSDSKATPLQSLAEQFAQAFARTYFVYGHLHGLGIKEGFSGELQQVNYRLCSLDAIDFAPLPLL